MSTAVEFKKANTAGHPKTTRAVQSLRIEQGGLPETWTITVLNPGAGQYKLTMKSPKETTAWISNAINSNTSAAALRTELYNYFSANSRTGSDIGVNLVMYDAANAVTTVAANAKKYIYTIKLVKRITGSSFTTATVATLGTISSTITVQSPSNGGNASGAPLSGSFVIKCTDLAGTLYKTSSISVLTGRAGIRNVIQDTMPYLRTKIELIDSFGGSDVDNFKFRNFENGRNFAIIFTELEFNPPLCTIASDTTTPITGDNPVFLSEVVRKYGESLMFEPIGLDFLSTSAQTPQVLVSVDGIAALCPDLNCNYSYISSTASITAQSYDKVTKVLTITGTSLPTSGLTVNFGGNTCATIPTPTFTSTQI